MCVSCVCLTRAGNFPSLNFEPNKQQRLVWKKKPCPRVLHEDRRDVESRNGGRITNIPPSLGIIVIWTPPNSASRLSFSVNVMFETRAATSNASTTRKAAMATMSSRPFIFHKATARALLLTFVVRLVGVGGLLKRSKKSWKRPLPNYKLN